MNSNVEHSRKVLSKEEHQGKPNMASRKEVLWWAEEHRHSMCAPGGQRNSDIQYVRLPGFCVSVYFHLASFAVVVSCSLSRSYPDIVSSLLPLQYLDMSALRPPSNVCLVLDSHPKNRLHRMPPSEKR